jgi:hypothetical protein
MGEYEQLMLAVLANGGYRYRAMIRGSTEDVERLMAGALARLRGIYLIALAGEMVAERWGKRFDLELTVKDLVRELSPEASKPPELPRPAAVPNRQQRRLQARRN